MKKLLKLHGLNSDMGYCELIVAHVISGQHAEANNMFMAMPKINRRVFVKMALTVWQSGLTTSQIVKLIDFI